MRFDCISFFHLYFRGRHIGRTESIRETKYLDSLPIWLLYGFKVEGSGGAVVLDELPGPGRPIIWLTVGQGPTALAVGAGGGCLDIFTLLCFFSPFSSSLGRRPDID